MSPPFQSLVEAVDDYLAPAPPDVRRRGQRLFRSFTSRLTAIGPPSGIATQIYDFGLQRLQLHLTRDGSALRGLCTCGSEEGAPCAHLLALALVIRDETLGANPAPAVTALRRALAPPTPAQLLADLDTLLAPLRESGRPGNDRPSWRIVERREGLTLDVRVRPWLAGGTLGLPQPVAPDVLAQALQRSPFPQDRAALGLFMQRHPSADRSDFRLGSDLRERLGTRVSAAFFEKLAGHPELAWAATNEPASIVSAPLALKLVEAGSDVRLHAAIGPFVLRDGAIAIDDTGVVGWDRAARTVYASTNAHVPPDLVERLARDPITVPASFAAELLTRLAPVESALPVDLPTSLKGRAIPADAAARVVIDPEAARGALVALKTRPIAGGPLLVPGVGEPAWACFVGGERLTTTRDLDAERDAVKALAARLAPLPFAAPGWDVLLDDEGLLDLVALLDRAEFADVPVEWPAADRPRVVAAGARARKVTVKAQEDWFGVEGAVEVGEDVVALAELFAAHRAGRRYVALGGNRFAEVARLVDERLARLADLTHDASGKVLRLSRAAVTQASEIFDGLDVHAPVAWHALARRARDAKTIDVTPPPGLAAALRDYQREGFAWMRRLAAMSCGAVLADDMGLGKTVQAIAMLIVRADAGPQLVVAPTSVGFNWVRELARFAPGLRARSHREGDRAALLASLGPGDVVVTSWALLRSEREALGEVRWTTLVMDEAQAIKNWDTETARAARAVRADWKLALTGTPVENHLGELYSLLQTVIPGLFASWEHFARQFATPIEKFGDKARSSELARLVRPFVLRRTKAEVLAELPPRIDQRLDIVLPKGERRLYDAARLDALRRLSEPDGDARFETFAALTRLRQLASCAHLVVPEQPPVSEKLRVLLDQLGELGEEGRSALVFSQFVRQLELVADELQKRDQPYLMLTGATPARVREQLVEAFQRGEAKVFLVSLKAGGTGLNLTAADTVFLLDPWWNPAVEDQAADRAHRIGQTRTVTVVRLVVKDTVEEKVLALHDRKRALVANVLAETDVAGKLSTADLMNLLADEPEARPAPPRDDRPLLELFRRAGASARKVAVAERLLAAATHEGPLPDRLLAAMWALNEQKGGTKAATRRLHAAAWAEFVRALLDARQISADDADRVNELVVRYGG